MLYDTKIVIGGYVGTYIEKYMEDLCARVDARDSFKENQKGILSLLNIRKNRQEWEQQSI